MLCVAGILDPYGYRTIEGDFICDYILGLFVDPSSIDENMNKDNPYLSCLQATQLLEKQFRDNNMPMPETAAAALTALSDKRLVMATDGQKHVMLSYQWDAQAVIQRVNESLIARGYATWFDLTNMKGKWLLWACRSIVVLLSARNVCVHLI